MLEDEAATQPIDRKRLDIAIQKLKKMKEESKFDSLASAVKSNAVQQHILKSFPSEPLEELLEFYAKEEIKLNYKTAEQLDLTDYVYLDFLYRWLNAGDVAMNIIGKPNKGKSNMALDFCLKWSAITGVPFKLSNISFYLSMYNLMLKGYKIHEENDVALVKPFELQRGEAIMLDEASDTSAVGFYGQTQYTETGDIEGRIRAEQIMRICAGTREITRQAYYSVLIYKRDPNQRFVQGYIYSKLSPGDINYYILGTIKVPYVGLELFQKYDKLKRDSIRGYARGDSGSMIAKLQIGMGRELMKNEIYQSLPVRPPTARITYLKSKPEFSIFRTNEAYKILEEISRKPIEKEKKEKKDAKAPELLFG